MSWLRCNRESGRARFWNLCTQLVDKISVCCVTASALKAFSSFPADMAAHRFIHGLSSGAPIGSSSEVPGWTPKLVQMISARPFCAALASASGCKTSGIVNTIRHRQTNRRNSALSSPIRLLCRSINMPRYSGPQPPCQRTNCSTCNFGRPSIRISLA